MTKTQNLDPQFGVRVVDAETNKPLATWGREDTAQMDYLQITVNGSTREVKIETKNDGETNDAIDLRVTLDSGGNNNVILENLPTSDPSVAGAVYSNSGVLTLSAG